MLLSVIISTWNNSHRLNSTLEALARCSVPAGMEWEVMLVNNNCTDETDRVVAGFQSRLPICYLREGQQGTSYAKNAGIRAARGKLLIFTDDDVKPCATWLSSYAQAFVERPQGFYFGGPVDSDYESDPPEEQLVPYCPPSVRGLNFGSDSVVLPAPSGLIGPNWACPAESIRTIGGFDTHLGLRGTTPWARVGEETDLMRRLERMGLSAYYVAGARVAHFVPAAKCKLPHIARRTRDYGFSEGLSMAEGYKGPSLFGVPLWVYRDLLVSSLQWMAARIRGRSNYLPYLRLQQDAGTLMGFRNWKLSRSRRKG